MIPESFGANLKQLKTKKTIVITVTSGRKNGIRKTLKLNNNYYEPKWKVSGWGLGLIVSFQYHHVDLNIYHK